MSWELYSLIEDDLARSSGREPSGLRPLIAHTHWRWSSVGTREREVLSRLSRRIPVFVIEPPAFADDVALGRIDLSMPMPNVWRAVPRLPSELIGDEEETLDRVRHFAQQMIGASAPLADRFPDPVQWFFTPMPAPRMLGAFGEAGVVYDCVDERVWARLAPHGALERERVLLDHADVVFASEQSALRIGALGHPNVHIATLAMSSRASATDATKRAREERWTRLVSRMDDLVCAGVAAHAHRRPRPAGISPAATDPFMSQVLARLSGKRPDQPSPG